LYLLSSVAYWAKEIFIALDPISSMHMGLTNDPDVQFRAELLSHFMLRKIPNSIVNEDEDPHQDVFAKKRESQKYQSSNPNTKFIPVGRTSMKYSAPTGPSGSGKAIATVRPFAKNSEEGEEEEEDTNGEFLPSGGRYKAPVVEKKTICITRIPFVTPMIPDESEKSTDNRFGDEDDAEPSDDDVHEFDAPAAFDTTVKKSIFTTKNKLGANTVFTSRGTSSTIFTTKGAFKRGTMAIPFSAGARIVPVASNAQVFGQATEAPKKRQTDTKRRSFIQSMSLDDMFCSETYLFEARGLAPAEALAAYTAICAAGCNSTQDLLNYLDTHRQQVSCNCGYKPKNGMQRGSGRGNTSSHAVDCDSRMAGVWADSLVKMGIPAFHAMKIVEALKKDLK